MYRVITFNLNGIRSAARKGFFVWLEQQDADVVCLQETKAQEHQLTDSVFKPNGYYTYFFDAEKKGYSGVAIYCKQKPLKITTGLGWQTADSEGRYIQADFKNLSVASLYLPSGTSSSERQQVKYDFLDKYLKILKKQVKDKREHIICGDWNIAHTKIDLKNWQTNQKNSGFLPEERAWLDTLFNKVGFVDAFRYKNPDKIEYTWWSARTRAWDNNVGWRIDYQIISPGLKDKIIHTSTYRGEQFSDHAPLMVDYSI
jgi:exodeoxyribonuclease III